MQVFGLRRRHPAPRPSCRTVAPNVGVELWVRSGAFLQGARDASMQVGDDRRPDQAEAAGGALRQLPAGAASSMSIPNFCGCSREMLVPEVARHLICSKCAARNSDTYNAISEWPPVPGSEERDIIGILKNSEMIVCHNRRREIMSCKPPY